MSKYILISAIVALVVACSPHDLSETGDLDAVYWRYATDPHGSKATYDGELVQQGIARIEFHRVPRVDARNNSWVELIYDLPAGRLQDEPTIELRYQSSTDLVVKLSQRDYGELGDQSYAHYQAIVPATDHWQSVQLSVGDFQRPNWTPEASADQGIVPAHVNAIYLVPDLTDDEGGAAQLAVRSITIQP